MFSSLLLKEELAFPCLAMAANGVRSLPAQSSIDCSLVQLYVTHSTPLKYLVYLAFDAGFANPGEVPDRPSPRTRFFSIKRHITERSERTFKTTSMLRLCFASVRYPFFTV